MKHSQVCLQGPASCRGYPECYEPVCVTCGGPLPAFPAFISHGRLVRPVTGPYCDEHAVITSDNEGDPA